jgi:hypothetical protein
MNNDERKRCERIARAASSGDALAVDHQIVNAVVGGLAKDLAEPVRRITATRLEQRMICEVGSPRMIRVLEVVANDEDPCMFEARDATGRVWASAPHYAALRDRLFGMTLPE